MSIQADITAKRQEVLAVAGRHHASNIRLFGSVARGEETPQSDIDLLVTLGADASLFDLVQLRRSLTDLLGRDVDVVEDTAIHWFIRDRILQEAKPL